jgi:hypothetical protein
MITSGKAPMRILKINPVRHQGYDGRETGQVTNDVTKDKNPDKILMMSQRINPEKAPKIKK